MREAEDMLEQAAEELKQGQFESAVEKFTAVLEHEPQSARAFQGRAIALFQIKQWSRAVSDFSTAKEIDPEDPENWIGLGTSLVMMQEVYPAIDVLEGLLQKHQDSIRGHMQLGMLYYKLCVTAKGREHMEKALALRPSLSERRAIETILDEEKKLDAKRLYRPDFEALRKKKNGQAREAS